MTNWQELHGSFFNDKKCLITGGAGFIGSHITEALISLGAQIVVLDDLSGCDDENMKLLACDQLTFIKGDIRDRKTVEDATAGCHYVFHQAALGSVPRSVEHPRLFQDVNVNGMLNVLEAAREAGVKRLMFAASSSAYGDSETLPKIENMPVRAKSPYAANKVAGEALLRAYSGSYGLDTAALRYFNIFGPRQNANSAYAAVIAAFAKAINKEQNPIIFGDGEQSRDFTFVHNAVHANLLAARSEKPINGEVLNVATATRITVNQLAEEMAKLMGQPQLSAEHLEDRAGDVKHSLACLEKTKATLGYQPIIDFETGLKATVEWYQSVLV